MSDTHQKASKGAIKIVLMIFVLAILLAVGYLTLSAMSEVEPNTIPPVSEGSQ